MTTSLLPKSTISSIELPVTGNTNNVVSALPFGIYSHDPNFITGASDQVSFVYRMLGGDVLSLEITDKNVYASYENACLEYSYFVNLYQAKSSLPSLLGNTTASFNQDGELKAGLLSSSLSGTRVELLIPHFDLGYIRQVATKTSELAGVGGNLRVYSASIDLVDKVQEYDLQGIVANDAGMPWQGKVDNKPIRVTRVYYKSPRVMWRFFRLLWRNECSG